MKRFPIRIFLIFLIGGLAVAIAALAAFAGSLDDRKAPPPIERARKLCLYVEGFPGKCQEIEARVLERWRLTPGRTVSAPTMLLIDEDNRAFRSTKYR